MVEDGVSQAAPVDDYKSGHCKVPKDYHVVTARKQLNQQTLQSSRVSSHSVLKRSTKPAQLVSSNNNTLIIDHQNNRATIDGISKHYFKRYKNFDNLLIGSTLN